MFKYSYTNKRYHSLDYYYRQRFGFKIAKISLNGGFTCPNKDGTKGLDGCIYCSKLGSGDFGGNPALSLRKQFDDLRCIIDKKWENAKYIAYFQANTNTYDTLENLKRRFEEVLTFPNVIGLAIATRPDAIEEEVLDYLSELSKRTYLSIELGLQTSNDKTAQYINRGHDTKCFEETVKRLNSKNIEVVAHIINGLPGESKEDMINTVKFLNSLDIDGIKIHMLNVIKNTKLADIYDKEKFPILELEEYCNIVCEQLECLKEDIVIHRITSDPDPDDLIAPLWTVKKFIVMNTIDKMMKAKNIYQGDDI